MEQDKPTINSTTAGLQRYRFGDYVLDQVRGSLSRDGTEIFLRPKSFAVLSYLLENAGRLVKRTELLDAVWPNVVVTDDSISQCLIEIRQAIEDTNRDKIRTVPRQGLIFEVPVEIHQAELTSKPGSRRNSVRTSWAWVTVLLIATVFALSWHYLAPPDASTEPAGRKSIAVLKFADMSPPPGHAWLAEGVSEEIIHMLAQGATLDVIARTSSFALAGEPIDVIAEKLGVHYVLEGSIRKNDRQLRVTAQLIDVETGAHLWSRSFDLGLDDLIGVQKEIATALAKEFNVSLADPNSTNPKPQAYERFLEARYFFNRRGVTDLELAQRRLEEALEIDPEFARAWAELAHVIINRLNNPSATVMETGMRAQLKEQRRHAIEQALKFGPDLPEAHHQAAVQYYFNGNWEKAVEHIEFNRMLNPDHPVVMMALAHEYRNSGRIDDARKLMQKLLAHDPLNTAWRGSLVQDSLWSGHQQDVAALIMSMRELNSASAEVALVMGGRGVVALILTGEFDRAEAGLEALPDNSERAQAEAMLAHAAGLNPRADAALSRLLAYGDSQENLLRLAETYAYRGEDEPAIEMLQAIEFIPDCSKDHFLQSIYYSPFLAMLDTSRDWVDIRERVYQLMQDCRLGLQ